MNKIFTILLIVLNSTLFAQDQVAKDVLDKLSATTKSYQNMTIGFDFILENTSQYIKETQKGILILENDNFRLEMYEQTIINDGESQWVYLADMNEVQIMEHDPEDDMMSPNKLFTIYEKGYKYTYIGVEAEKGNRLHIIDLSPKESGPIMKIRLTINALKNQISILQLYDKTGGVYTYNIKNFKSNLDVAPFNFDTTNYPEVEVIDLR
jgi:outer membrane lipoprotein-sorting protein